MNYTKELDKMLTDVITRFEQVFDGIEDYSHFKGVMHDHAIQMRPILGLTADEAYGYCLVLYIFQGYLLSEHTLHYKDIISASYAELLGKAVGTYYYYNNLRHEFSEEEANEILEVLEGKTK